MTDEEVVHLIVKNERTGLFSVLYERYADKVFRKCLSFEKERTVAKDLAHDVFIKVFLQLSNFQERSRFSTWLYSITYNHCVEYHRKKNKMPTDSLDDKHDIAYGDDDLEDETAFAIQTHILRKALDRVGVEDRMILLMKYQDGSSIKELMNVLNVSESAVKMRLARARKRMKTIMTELLKYE
jgi:RNA polymerase sigma-70 factor (ECF subfamily)